MKTYEEIKAFYMSIGESEKAATRHAKQAMQLQNSEALMESYRKGSQIKVRQEAAKFNNMR